MYTIQMDRGFTLVSRAIFSQIIFFHHKYLRSNRLHLAVQECQKTENVDLGMLISSTDTCAQCVQQLLLVETNQVRKVSVQITGRLLHVNEKLQQKRRCSIKPPVNFRFHPFATCTLCITVTTVLCI